MTGTAGDRGDERGNPAAAGGGRLGLVARVVAWLREGYPTGVPAHDYVPLLALLRRRLSQDEVAEVARRLRSGTGLPDQVDVGVGITHVTGEVPDPGDVERVLRHLADTTHGSGPLDEGAG